MVENWKDIKGYENIYQISNKGNVKRLKSYDKRNHLRNERILKQYPNKDGYYCVGLYKDSNETKFLVHRLVAETFMPNPNNYLEVNHKDETRTNNCLENLEWCDRKYNSTYGTAQIRRLINFRSTINKRRNEQL